MYCYITSIINHIINGPKGSRYPLEPKFNSCKNQIQILTVNSYVRYINIMYLNN